MSSPRGAATRAACTRPICCAVAIAKTVGSRTRTLGNLSHLPEPLIEVVRRSLRGEVFVPLEARLEVLRSRPHGHVQAVRRAMQRLGMDSLLASRPSPERERICALIAARVLAPHTKLATTRWWHTSTLAEEFGVTAADEDDLYVAMDWLAASPSPRTDHPHRLR